MDQKLAELRHQFFLALRDYRKALIPPRSEAAAKTAKGDLEHILAESIAIEPRLEHWLRQIIDNE